MATSLAQRVVARARVAGHLARYSTTSSPSLGIHLAASFSAKDRPYDPSSHVFSFGSPSSKSATRPESGHDAFFVRRVGGSDAVAFGVADGVGGWTESGVDPADFSHGLCRYMADAAGSDLSKPRPVTARKLMEAGYDAVCRDKSLVAGGSTACVAVASSDGVVDVANLGDSGYLQLRLNAVNAVSAPQTHAFNTPYQLSLLPPHMVAGFTDLPRDADVSQHQLRHGDVLLLATDGLLDNLFHQDILRIISRVMVVTGAWSLTSSKRICVADTLANLVTSSPAGSPLQVLLATELVAAAKAASINTRIDGPFAKEVKRYYPRERWHGGKIDDICVIVAVACEKNSTSREAES
ncbi:hypothetical protein CDD80_2896 [Ophiocordyceps camponoti-rufipedis]|uniref:Protein phosphatase n=1 Tax=Ophiocordyceps camponoti-rufipedis TaxID=2004952 RepID=A0A2C5Y9E2_9HYPO|nr:hypothetical protein CDD80_2896 [Ophiocordyceps camponoti-rufipedis]